MKVIKSNNRLDVTVMNDETLSAMPACPCGHCGIPHMSQYERIERENPN